MPIARGLALALLLPATVGAQVTDLSKWTLVQDPPNAFLEAETFFDGSSWATTLSAGDGTIPSGTDIGLKSVNGDGAADSSAGFVFSPDADFQVAIDYSLSFTGQGLNMGFGFGVGERADGANSAGAAVARAEVTVPPLGSQIVLGVAAAGRANDVNLDPKPLGSGFTSAAATSGSLFVAYTAATGTITLGYRNTTGAATPQKEQSFDNLQQSWSGDDLVVSFFLRSDNGGWSGDTWQTVFSNLRVLSGTPKTLPPRITSVARSGGQLLLDFEGGAGWDYWLEGGSSLAGFLDDLTDAPGTSLVEQPPGSGDFAASIDVGARGPSYFLRVSTEDPTP